MIPNLSSPGSSFKGAFKYHAHDKDTLETSDRVDWHVTRGLMTDDLETAERIMIATAYDADRLKEQAGIKATGRKSVKHVQTLSLAWHPDEQVSQAEMERAADSALNKLGLADHQAVIIAHNDTAHAHIHMIVNRVNPNDGRLASLSNSKRELDRWAHDYEKERGHIVTPKRAEKYDRQRQASERHSSDERRAYVEKKRSEAQRRRPHNIRAELSQRQQNLRQRHGSEWSDLKHKHRSQRQEDYQAYKVGFEQTKQQYDTIDQANREKKRAEWGALYKHQRDSAQQRKQMGKSPTGRLALAVIAAREEKREGSQEGFLRLTMANFISTQRRERAFAIVGKRDKAALANRQNFGRDKAFQHLRAKRAEQIESRRSQQADDRQALKSKQTRERDAMRKEWAALGVRRQGHRERDTQRHNDIDAATRLKAIREEPELPRGKAKPDAAERLAELRKADRGRSRVKRDREDKDFER